MSTPTRSPSTPTRPSALDLDVPLTIDITATPQLVLDRFPTYAGAERLVDRLADSGFPVQHLRIVGTELRTVEYVTGRVTTARASAVGAGTGAWFGVLIALLVGWFSIGTGWLALLLVAPLMGAFWGGVLGFLAHWATGGRRDFSSVKGLEALQYAVYVDAGRADDARRMSGQA